MSSTSQSIDELPPIVSRRFRFTSLLGGVIVAYPDDRQWAVVVKMENKDDQWSCYCSDVEFTLLTSDQRVCRFVCNGREFECQCRILHAYVHVDRIAKAADDLWSAK